jgi:hypothetical protein
MSLTVCFLNPTGNGDQNNFKNENYDEGTIDGLNFYRDDLVDSEFRPLDKETDENGDAYRTILR